MKIKKNSLAYFIIVITLFNFWVAWMETKWLFLFNLLVVDFHITGYLPWNRIRLSDNNPFRSILEWAGAIILALIAAFFLRLYVIEAYTIPSRSMENTLLVGDYIFVGKLSYGPKMPITPLSIPFTHNTLPGTNKKSYVNWIQLSYKRLNGLSNVQRNDILVFHFPEGDTVSTMYQSDASYYQLCRLYGRDYVKSNPGEYGNLVYRPVDKRDNFIKRCIALPGDTLYIERGVAYINGKVETQKNNLKFNYLIKTDGSEIPFSILQKIGIENPIDIYNTTTRSYEVALNAEAVRTISRLENVKGIRRSENHDAAFSNTTIFPFSKLYPWTEDFFGPIYIPKKGDTIPLNSRNLPLYQRIIETYERNTLVMENDDITING